MDEWTLKDRILWEIEDAIRRRLEPCFRVWYRLLDFLFVVRNWRRYRDVVAFIYQPWFDVSAGGHLLYMSNPDDLRCMFCGAEYPKVERLDLEMLGNWTREPRPELPEEKHREGCLWTVMIEPLRREQMGH